MANKILSVDDSYTVRQMVRGVVETLGMEFLEAENGLEALKVMEKSYQDVALVILDVNMPEMGGEETLKNIKADIRYKKIPVMMLTTESERAKIIGFIRSGADNYMVKPFVNEDLASKIAGCIGDLF